MTGAGGGGGGALDFPKIMRILSIPSKRYSVHSVHSAIESRMNGIHSVHSENRIASKST